MRTELKNNKNNGVYYCDKSDTVLIAIIEPRFCMYNCLLNIFSYVIILERIHYVGSISNN